MPFFRANLVNFLGICSDGATPMIKRQAPQICSGKLGAVSNQFGSSLIFNPCQNANGCG